MTEECIQTIKERDYYHEMADELADAIAKHFGVEIGEHSNLEGRLQIFKKQQVSQIFVSPCIKNNQLKHLINTSYYFLWRNTFDLKK